MVARWKQRLGSEFNKVWLSKAVSNLGDGVSLAAGPLLVASLTSDPILVSGAVFVRQLPWLLFSLPAGVMVDRVDRRKLIITVNLARGLLLALLCFAVASDFVTVALIYAVFFCMGTAATLADNASSTLLPSIVPDEQLTQANSRVVTTWLLGNQFVGPPVGALLFTIAPALPIGFDAYTFGFAGLVLVTLRWRPERSPQAQATSVRDSLREGTHWLMRQRTLRTLAVTVGLLNLTYMLAFGVLVLYARERLGASEAAFGLLLTAGAVGGLLGSGLASRAEEHFGPGALVRMGLVTETLSLVVLSVTRSFYVAAVALLLAAVVSTLWGITVMGLRQRLVPDELRGRVGSVYLFLTIGGGALGAALSGFVAHAGGIVAPFWTAAAANVMLLLAVWRSFANDKLLPVELLEPAKGAVPSGSE